MEPDRKHCSEQDAVQPEGTRESRSLNLHETLSNVATAMLAACDGVACVIAWRSRDDRGIVHAPDTAAWRAPLRAVATLAQQASEHRPIGESVTLGAARLRAILSERLSGGRTLQGVALTAGRGSPSVTVTILSPVARNGEELTALARLGCTEAQAALGHNELAASRAFWRVKASDNGERLAAVRRELAAIVEEQSALESVVRDCRELSGPRRFAALGARIARFGGFPAWIVAHARAGELRVAAASVPLRRMQPLTPEGPAAECLRRNYAMVRVTNGTVSEDRLFAPFPSYVYIPIATCAIGLASSETITPELVARLERLAAALAPVAERWDAHDEVARLQDLVRSLGLRLFGAIDGERARIARDLHDDQAQLLAAARIALAADPDEARKILKQLDEELRKRVRELRPASLGRSTLTTALSLEIGRLAEAGIKARLVAAEWVGRLARPLQELCYQVAREGVSNVIRHSGATRAAIRMERRRGRVVLRIDDNGNGAAAAGAAPTANANTGIGLAAMAERLKLMGGELRLERGGGMTRLTAEAPEL
jgi:signal transduction histidine kinase